jgi:magnesium chelatase family protein
MIEHASQKFPMEDLVPSHREIAEAVRADLKAGKSVLLIGAPGAGKTMIARRAAAHQPPIKDGGWVTTIYRLSGLPHLSMLDRPFRAPHHTCSLVGMTGGGRGGSPRPGEMSLAHMGVLFLDELPEFQRSVLHEVSLVQREKVVDLGNKHIRSLPADFLLIGATLPCPCGYYLVPPPPAPSISRCCTCNEEQVDRYRARYSMLRFDTQYRVYPASIKELKEHNQIEGA